MCMFVCIHEHLLKFFLKHSLGIFLLSVAVCNLELNTYILSDINSDLTHRGIGMITYIEVI